MTKSAIAQLQQSQKQERITGTALENQPIQNILPPADQSPEPNFFQGFGKAAKIFLDENSVLSTTRYANEEGANLFQRVDPSFDPFVEIPKDKLDYIDHYKFANSSDEISRISGRIDKENENRRILDEEVGTGASLGAALLTGIAEPINFLPIGGQAFRAWKVGRVGQGALRTGAAGLVSQTAVEGILQAEQETRAAEESAFNIAGATILGGILGGGASLLSKEKFHATAKNLETDINTEKSHLEIDPETQQVRNSSVGAMQTPAAYENHYQNYLVENAPTGKQPMTLEEFKNKAESLSTERLGGAGAKVAQGLNKINPLLRVFHSQSIEAKTLLQDLATHNMLVGKNELGIASQQAVENNVKQYRAGLGQAIPENNTAFKMFKERAKTENLQTTIKNQADFNEAVSKSLRRGDVSDIPEVAQAAKTWRSKVFDPLKNEAIGVNLLPKDVQPETAVSYLSRLWNRQAVVAYEPELRQIISNKLINVELPKVEFALKKAFSDLEAKITKLEKQLKAKKPTPELEKLRTERVDTRLRLEAVATTNDKADYAREITNSILSNLKGESRFNATSNYDFKITKRGPLQERTLSFIRDEEVEKFLENDVVRIADRYTKIMGTDVELARKFDGDVNLEARMAKVSEDYDKIAEKAKTPEAKLKVQKEKESVLRDLSALRDIQRGIYGQPDDPDSLIVRGFRVGRQLNYVSKMGGVVISSFADMANPIFVHGFGRWAKGLSHVMTNMKGIKLNVKEAKLAGNILENVLHTRLATFAEITDPLETGRSTFEKFVNNIQTIQGKLNLMGLWNDVQKGFSSVITQQRLIDEIGNLEAGKIKKSDRTYLAALGIDKDNFQAISAELKNFAEKEDGLWVANTEKWKDREAVQLYRNALNQDVDRTIVTKTAGDVPLFMNTEVGKAIGQFKSFTFATTQQILIAGLQRGDAAALSGATAAISLGMLTYYLKSIGAGREVSDDWKKWVIEGTDRSGYLGIAMEINNISEKMTRGTVGINALIGGESMSRYASRNLVGSLVGPTAGQIEDLAKITGAISTGEISESDVKAFRRMLPYQNLFYLQGLFNEVEEGVNKTLGNQ